MLSDKPAEVGKPRLRWPGDPKDRDVKNMADGLRQFAPGVQMLIRNTVIHATGELDQQPALERLATLSLLSTWIGQCELVEFGEVQRLANPDRGAQRGEGRTAHVHRFGRHPGAAAGDGR